MVSGSGELILDCHTSSGPVNPVFLFVVLQDDPLMGVKFAAEQVEQPDVS
jgi:hypothetical protein